MRLNLTDPTLNPEDMGTRTDLRFVGATMLERHTEALKQTTDNCLVVSTDKNLELFSKLGIASFLYDRRLPRRAFQLLSENAAAYQPQAADRRAPRSGIVALALSMACSSPRQITLAGFSTRLEEASMTLNFKDNSAVRYEATAYEKNHCSPEVELMALHALASGGDIKIL